ncbi:DUF2752 domain-containing protein [Daejeonella sp.]|uniref:DUF2752 domain-containing protein n=1 Tax=Daejeonella sp. TaxID=2805397 RepID=UPI0034365805
MTLSRNKLYIFIITACLTGYIWLYWSLSKLSKINTEIEVCLIKNITTIPCPSCGSTRSVLAITQGNFNEAFFINPLGYILAFIMFFIPFWIFFDFILKKETFLNIYQKAESILKRPIISIPLLIFILINWAWNIVKGL